MSEGKNQCEIKCPECGKESVITIPPEILATRKMGLMKINIDQGVCCEHQFIVFVSKNLKAAGYEKMDISMVVTPDEGPKYLSLRQMVEKFGKDAVSHFIEALFMDNIIVFIQNPNNPIDTKFLNESFNLMLPDELKKSDLVITLPQSAISDKVSEYALVFNPETQSCVYPWTRKSNRAELYLIDYTCEVLDENTHSIFVQELMKLIYQKADFTKTYLESKEPTTDKNLQLEVQKIFGEWKFRQEWDIIKTILGYRLTADLSKIR